MRSLRLPQLLSTFSLLSLAAPLFSQSYTWIQNPANGHYYALTAPMSWTAAESAAQRAGGHLATIRNRAENDWIASVFGATPPWIGFSDAASEGQWTWSSGEAVTFTNWCPGQPDNSQGIEDFGHIQCGMQGWNDLCPAHCIDLPGLIEVVASHASYVTYRMSCPSSVGTPVLSATIPHAGQAWTLTVTNLRVGAVGHLIFALDDQFLGLIPLPMDLDILGAPGCFLNVNSDPMAGATLPFLLPNSAGQAVTSIGIPNVAAVLGFTFYNQYVSLDAPTGRALHLTTTNAGRGIVGI